MGSETRVFNQINVNHDQRVVIGHQQLVQNNKVLIIQTHDPAYAEVTEQTAKARHRLAIAETEAQANVRHEAIADSLKEALKIHEAQECSHARGALREREENIKSEAVQHVRAHEVQCKVKVEAYQRILDANLRQSMAAKGNEMTHRRSASRSSKSWLCNKVSRIRSSKVCWTLNCRSRLLSKLSKRQLWRGRWIRLSFLHPFQFQPRVSRLRQSSYPKHPCQVTFRFPHHMHHPHCSQVQVLSQLMAVWKSE